jgi:hypothetical protein
MSFPRIPRAWTWFLFGIIALCGLAPLPLTAQPIGILLQHGINSDSMTWKQANDSLAIKYAVPIRRFTTGSSGTYEVQASTLLSRMGGPFSGWAYAGHSNGAQVGREATSIGASYAGIVSVGSPLQGAWIAQSVNNHSVVHFVDNVVYETFNPLATISQFFQVGQDYHIEALFDLLGEMADAATAAEYVLNVAPAFLGPDLLQEMVPGSGYLNSLNGARLSSELSHEAIRISIVSSLSTNKGIQFRSVFSAGAAADLADFYDFLSGAYLAAAVYTATYQDYSNPYWSDVVWSSQFFKESYDFLTQMEPTWCGLIGARDANGCTPSDAIVPLASQTLAGWTQATLSVHDASHSEETRSQSVLQALVLAFDQMQVPRRSTTSPLAIGALAGPTSVEAQAPATWSVAVNGGVPPYSFAWRIGSATPIATTTSSYTYTNTGSSFRISVTVTDALGASATSFKDVTVASGCGGTIYCE